MKNIFKFIAVIASAAILMTGCGAKETTGGNTVTSLSEAGVKAEIIGHRGGISDAPENSLSAFRDCIKNGYYAAECDIMLTKDERWVITHDNKISKHFEGSGKISDKTFEEVRQLKYISDSDEYDDEIIPSLEEYLDLFSGTETRPQIEIKCTDTDHLDYVIKAIEKRGLINKVIIISFHINQLKLIHEKNPDIEVWYLVDGKITDKDIENAKDAGCNVISFKYSKNDEKSVRSAIDSGLGTATWTIDDIETAKTYAGYGVKYITSNTLVK